MVENGDVYLYDQEGSSLVKVNRNMNDIKFIKINLPVEIDAMTINNNGHIKIFEDKIEIENKSARDIYITEEQNDAFDMIQKVDLDDIEDVKIDYNPADLIDDHYEEESDTAALERQIILKGHQNVKILRHNIKNKVTTVYLENFTVPSGGLFFSSKIIDNLNNEESLHTQLKILEDINNKIEKNEIEMNYPVFDWIQLQIDKKEKKQQKRDKPEGF